MRRNATGNLIAVSPMEKNVARTSTSASQRGSRGTIRSNDTGLKLLGGQRGNCGPKQVSRNGVQIDRQAGKVLAFGTTRRAGDARVRGLHALSCAK
jgi:hypothetical protein